ncbi:MAG: YcxB family protein [Clostridia bacterium]|nr:YcxB family protein [Clostridia bacterium]
MFPFKVSTRLTEEDQIALNETVAGKPRRIVTIVFSVLLAAYALIIAIEAIALESVDPMLILLGACILLVLVCVCISKPLTRRSVRRNVAKMGETECEFTFYEDRFEEEFRNKLESGTNTVNYASFEKVAEDGERFFLFRSAMVAYVLRKCEMTEEQAAALREAIAGMLPPKKYRRKK